MESKLYEKLLEAMGGKNNIGAIGHSKSYLTVDYKEELEIKFGELASYESINHVIIEEHRRLTIEIINEEIAIELYDYIDEVMTESKVANKFAGAIDKAFDFIAQVFAPIIPGLAGSGILKGILLLLVQLGLLSDTSGLFVILNIASNAIFYFLPVILAFSAARVLKANPFIAVLIPFTLLHPELIALVEQSSEYDFFKIPLVLIDYSSTVLPIIISVIFYAFVYHYLNKKTPESLKIIVLPLATLVLVVPVTLLLIGPLGQYGGDILAQFVSFLIVTNGTLTGMLIGGFWIIIIMMGLNWAINPIMLNNLSLHGFDFIRPLTFAANFSTIGVVVGLFFSTKIKETKNFAATNIFTISVSGIIEPTLYGILIKDRRYFIAQILGGMVGGAYLGFQKVVSNAFVFGSLITLPALVTDQVSNLIHGLIGLFIATFVSAILSFIITKVVERSSI